MSKIILRNVRLSFPSIWETEKYNGVDTEKYTATFLIQKDAPVVKTIQDEMIKLAQEKFGKPIPKSVKYALTDGDEKEYQGYEGHWAIKASTKRRPTIIDRDKSPLVEDDGKPYAGCYVNASIELWVMDNQYGKRVLANLNGIQFASDGEAFGAGPTNAADDFDEIDEVESESPF